MKLIELTKMLRSKNAGPLWLTMDLSFDSPELLEKVLSSGALNSQAISKLYNVPEGQVKIIPYPVVNAVKITVPRLVPSGDLLDTDIYGCQQHMALANLEVNV